VLYGFVALTIPAIFRLTRDSVVDRTIGELSYPIYITHALLLAMLVAVAKRLGFTPSVELLVVVVGCVSWILYMSVDRPVQAWRERFAKPPKTS
jgi:peptidoglycan/LPS O-acetylase OafA/YrhL